MIEYNKTLKISMLFFVFSSSAIAIECVKDFQRINGQLLASPYCADEYLATVARGYGLKVTASQLRSNPNFKKDICRTVFTDNRVSLICEAAGVPEYRR